MTEPVADVASAVALGRRHRQEDAVVVQFSEGADSGFAVLSDGMGGHDDGDLAARVIVAEVFRALSLSGRSKGMDPALMVPETLTQRLRQAILSANQSLRAQVEAGAGQQGMGGTVITAVVQNDLLSWISIGDSALYLFRGDRLFRLNEVHSLAPRIDLMVERGEIDAETARSHPQRSYLTSALVGGAINQIDCPGAPIKLMAGDVVLMASDGLEVLANDRLVALLARHRESPSAEIARALLQAVAQHDAPEQDNTSIIVIKPWLEQPEVAEVPQVRPASLPKRRGLSDLRHGLAALLTGRSAL